MDIEVDFKELRKFEKNLARVPSALDTNIKEAFNKTAEDIIELATIFKPDIKYASGYRSGELNRSYQVQSKGKSGTFETEISNEARHFNSVEAGSTSSNVLYGYFQQGWRTGSGKAMFVTGEGTNARLYQMSPWKGYFMLRRATYDPSIEVTHRTGVVKAIDRAFSKALGG